MHTGQPLIATFSEGKQQTDQRIWENQKISNGKLHLHGASVMEGSVVRMAYCPIRTMLMG
jgi:hypothetical protein